MNKKQPHGPPNGTPGLYVPMLAMNYLRHLEGFVSNEIFADSVSPQMASEVW